MIIIISVISNLLTHCVPVSKPCNQLVNFSNNPHEAGTLVCLFQRRKLRHRLLKQLIIQPISGGTRF